MPRRIKFHVGMALNINDECTGQITKMTRTKIFIRSEVFTGWATKKEIREAILSVDKTD